MAKIQKIIPLEDPEKIRVVFEPGFAPTDPRVGSNYEIQQRRNNIIISVKNATTLSPQKYVDLELDQAFDHVEKYKIKCQDAGQPSFEFDYQPDIVDVVTKIGDQLFDQNHGLPQKLDILNAIGYVKANAAIPDPKDISIISRLGEQKDLAEKRLKLAEDQTLFPPSSTGSGVRAVTSGAGSLQNLVEGAARQVLGVSLQKSNPRAFQTALVSSFQRQSGGQRAKYQLVAHSYVPSASDGTRKTNTQAALLILAKKNVDEALTLLRELKPLDTIGADEKRKFKSSQAIFTRQLTELGKELVREGGPRIPRANEIITELKNKFKKPEANIDNTGNDEITTGLGIKDKTANIVIEEQNQAAYDTIASAIDLIQTSFDAYKRNIGQSWPANSINNLIEKLAVVAESVDGLYAALDLVQIDADERALVDLKAKSCQMSLEDVLSWTTAFVTDEAPGTLAEPEMEISIAKESLKSTAGEIKIWIDTFLNEIKKDKPTISNSKGFTHASVIEAATELKTNFDSLCDELNKP